MSLLSGCIVRYYEDDEEKTGYRTVTYKRGPSRWVWTYLLISFVQKGSVGILMFGRTFLAFWFSLFGPCSICLPQVNCQVMADIYPATPLLDMVLSAHYLLNWVRVELGFLQFKVPWSQACGIPLMMGATSWWSRVKPPRQSMKRGPTTLLIYWWKLCSMEDGWKRRF